MPSLFSRARTASTPNKKPSFLSSHDEPALDEFGRVTSNVSNRGNTSTPSKKDKKKAEKRNKTLNSKDFQDDTAVAEPAFPDGTFLPLSLERPKHDPDAADRPRDHDYGFLCYERHVVLGLEQAARLVNVVSDELESRGGITTPFIFSTTALDISFSAIKRLIRAFLGACAASPGRAWEDANRKWREEARFAGPHELGMCLRWGLARIIRSVGGQDVRGLVSWDHYCEFRDSEAALGYPPNHFEYFIQDLIPDLQTIVLRVLTLLTRLTANSTSSGHTPPTLSPLFGPLVFGLGPATLTFHHAYIHYLRAVNAMEHILLAFIRWQDTPAMASNGIYPSGSAAALGVPTRLKEWIKGYPSMLPMLHQPKNARPEPRKGARTIRVMSVRRNVRMYSPDLVKSATTWASRKPGGSGWMPNGLASSKEWDRIAPWSLKLPPRYSEGYKKRMNMPPNFHPEVSPGTYASDGLSQTSSTSSYTSTLSTKTSTTATSMTDSDYFGLGGREGEDRFRSLTDLKWGEFEAMGFGGLGDEKKLQFDLTESARTERSAKRATLSWNDFSSAGFTRTDGSLSATLQFSTPVTQTVSSWPTQNAEISKKLKKTHKSLPAFGWDTEPVIGSEEVVEDAFMDVFCDLIYGGGWMDLERGEMLDRDCNWALVEYKSIPDGRSTVTGGSDPRTSSTLVLFEEFVPLEYRQQLAVTSTTRRRLPSLFSAGKSKQWKQAATLNGRPYVVGHVPRSPSYREVEFDSLLRGGGGTKVISLGSKNAFTTPTRAQTVPEPPASTSRIISKPLFVPEEKEVPPAPVTARSDEMHSDSTSPSVTSPSMKRMSRFKLPGGIPVPSPGGLRKTGITPAEYSTVDFETRMASYSDDEVNGQMEPESVKQKRRESRDDAWVDILVNSHSRRIGGQDAELGTSERRRGMRGRRSDPDLASLEVAQVLASVQNRSPSPPSIHHSDRVDRDYGMDQHLDDLDVVEIETVPRTSDARRYVDTDEEDEVVLAYRDDRDHDQESEYPADEEDIAAHETEPEPEPEPKPVAKQQRRLGYFDLHPERRPIAKQALADDDPRARLARGDDSDEEGDSALLPTASSAIRPLPVPPRDQQPPRGPSPLARPSPEPDIVPYTPPEEIKRPEVERSLPIPPQRPVAVSVNIPDKPIATSLPSSKTAALIEMYRERERGGSPGASPVVPPPSTSIPSRLPVRTASLPKETLPFPVIPQSLPASPKPSPKISPPPPKPVTPPSPQPPAPEPMSIELPPPAPFVETGRASPARYVHGAPLHNVLEEEEEEE